MMDFSRKEAAPGGAVYVNFRSKNAQKGAKFRAPFTAKSRPKKSPSEANYAFVN